MYNKCATIKIHLCQSTDEKNTPNILLLADHNKNIAEKKEIRNKSIRVNGLYISVFAATIIKLAASCCYWCMIEYICGLLHLVTKFISTTVSLMVALCWDLAHAFFFKCCWFFKSHSRTCTNTVYLICVYVYFFSYNFIPVDIFIFFHFFFHFV